MAKRLFKAGDRVRCNAIWLKKLENGAVYTVTACERLGNCEYIKVSNSETSYSQEFFSKAGKE